ncbi:MAG TPA: rod shape-determining protein MreC [Oscillospiraceae bacterium]|nr:rod shape-determining protein MreC [Oscillospiraceae bacterium]
MPVHVQKNNRKNNNLKIISLVSVLSVLLLLTGVTANRQGATWPEEMLQYVVAPVQGVFQRLTRSVESVFSTARNYRLLRQENENLRQQLTEAVSLQTQIAELRQENDRLRSMLEYREASEYELITAEVIARDPSNWFKTITINQGTKDGIEPNMAVVTAEGLIGNILSAAPNSAQVQLLTNASRRVSALVQRSREPGEVGVVEYDPNNTAYLRMKDLPREANIQAGDTIISSGLGGVFPKGLLIGYVLETAEDEMGLTQYAQLQPAANFNRLEEVFVVIPQSDLPVIPEEEENL